MDTHFSLGHTTSPAAGCTQAPLPELTLPRQGCAPWDTPVCSPWEVTFSKWKLAPCIKATPAAWMISRCPITLLTRCKYHPLGNRTVPKESRSAMLKLCPNSEIFSICAGRRNLCGALRSPLHQGVGVSHNHSALPSADGPGSCHYRRRNRQYFQIHRAPPCPAGLRTQLTPSPKCCSYHIARSPCGSVLRASGFQQHCPS